MLHTMQQASEDVRPAHSDTTAAHDRMPGHPVAFCPVQTRSGIAVQALDRQAHLTAERAPSPAGLTRRAAVTAMCLAHDR